MVLVTLDDILAMTIEHNDERSAIEQLLRERGYERVRTVAAG